MKKFEYISVRINVDFDYVNELGGEGWELIGIGNKIEGQVYLFKREIPFVETKKTAKQLLQESYKHEE